MFDKILLTYSVMFLNVVNGASGVTVMMGESSRGFGRGKRISQGLGRGKRIGLGKRISQGLGRGKRIIQGLGRGKRIIQGLGRGKRIDQGLGRGQDIIINQVLRTGTCERIQYEVLISNMHNTFKKK